MLSLAAQSAATFINDEVPSEARFGSILSTNENLVPNEARLVWIQMENIITYHSKKTLFERQFLNFAVTRNFELRVQERWILSPFRLFRTWITVIRIITTCLQQGCAEIGSNVLWMSHFAKERRARSDTVSYRLLFRSNNGQIISFFISKIFSLITGFFLRHQKWQILISLIFFTQSIPIQK